MEKTRNKPKELLPYGMLLTRLFKHVVSVFPELATDHYISHDQVMHPFAPHYERKTRSDRGKKRPHESNASSSSTTLNHTSSSHPLDDTIDENDAESFYSNSSSPSQNISSSSNVVSRVLDATDGSEINSLVWLIVDDNGAVDMNTTMDNLEDRILNLEKIPLAYTGRFPELEDSCYRIAGFIGL
ncbi:hypothetical protein Tco_0490569 [Tanacetum coccineum]